MFYISLLYVIKIELKKSCLPFKKNYLNVIMFKMDFKHVLLFDNNLHCHLSGLCTQFILTHLFAFLLF